MSPAFLRFLSQLEAVVELDMKRRLITFDSGTAHAAVYLCVVLLYSAEGMTAKAVLMTAMSVFVLCGQANMFIVVLLRTYSYHAWGGRAW